MKNLQKYKNGIFIGILVGIGVCSALLGHNLQIQGGVSCLCWGLAILYLSVIAQQRNNLFLLSFDQEAREILEDIATNGENSEYYHFYNFQIIEKLRKKHEKKYRKQMFSILSLGVIFIIISIMCFV